MMAPTAPPDADPGRHRLKQVLRPLAGGPVYRALHGAAKAWDIRQARWSEPELALVPYLLRAGETALDVGANFGLWAYHLSVAVGDAGRVVAVEPLPDALTALRRVRTLLRLTNVEIVAAGAAEQPGRARLVVPLQSSGAPNAGLAHLEGRDDARSGVESHVPAAGRQEIDCELVRLDDLDLPGDVAFLKCDIEGAELAALRGATAILRRHAPTLLLEVDPWFLGGYGLTTADVFGWLHHYGYAAYRFDGEILHPVGAGEAEGNLLFVHPKRRRRVAGLLT